MHKVRFPFAMLIGLVVGYLVGKKTSQNFISVPSPQTSNNLLTTNGKSSRISAAALQEVQSAFRQYEIEVKQAGLSASTEQTYVSHSRDFVRWLKNEFQPGINLRLTKASETHST